MSFNGLWGFLFMVCVIWNVRSQPVEPSPIMVMITCMSVLHVMSDTVKHPDSTMWRGTAHHMQVWLNTHVHEQERMLFMQQEVETHVFVNLIDQPHTWLYWLSQAASCHQSFVHMMSYQV